jgi:hypothetical protein
MYPSADNFLPGASHPLSLFDQSYGHLAMQVWCNRGGVAIIFSEGC